MKGCFVFPHKEMKKANKGFRFFLWLSVLGKPGVHVSCSNRPSGEENSPMGLENLPWGRAEASQPVFLGKGLILFPVSW